MSDAKEPAYIQVRRFLLSAIESGRYGPGDLLPSETELAKRFGVTRSTVIHGLSALVSDGRINRIAGKGTFVARKEIRVTQHTTHIRSFDEEVVEHGAQIQFRLLSFTRLAAEAGICSQLKIPDGSDVFRLERVRLVDGTPTVLEIRYLPIDLGQKLTIDALSRLPMFAILTEAGRPVAHITGVIRVDAASADVASKLSIAGHEPVLVRDFVLSDTDMAPLVSGTAIFTREVQIGYAVDEPASG